MYPQRTPPESGMEKSGRRNLISSQCLACYVNLPTSPRLSCKRTSQFFKSYQIGKENRPSITLSKCYILSRISSSWKFESPLYTIAQGGLVKRTHQVPHIITNHPPSSLRTLDKIWTEIHCFLQFFSFMRNDVICFINISSAEWTLFCQPGLIPPACLLPFFRRRRNSFLCSQISTGPNQPI